MFHHIRIYALSLLIAGMIFGQDQVWRKWYDHVGYGDLGVGLTLDGSQNIIVTGWAGTNTHDDSVLTLKLNSDGELIWAKAWGWTNSSICRAIGHDVVCDNQNNIIVAGYKLTTISDTVSMLILKYDSLSTLLWEKDFLLPGSRNCGAVACALGSNNSIIVTGWDFVDAGGNSGDRSLTVKFDSLGNVIWSRTHGAPGSPGFDEGYADKCAVDPEGNIYLAGWFTYWEQEPPYRFCTGYWLFKYDSVGTLLWDKFIRYWDTVLHDYDGAYGIVLDAFGNPIITGCFNDHSRTIKLSPDGAVLWDHTFEEISMGYGICLDKVGNIIVVGTRGSNQPDFILTYDSLGNLVSVFNPPLPRTICYDVVADTSNYFYAVGGNIDAPYYDSMDVILDKYHCFVGVEDMRSMIPEVLNVLTVYPNPFSTLTKISGGIEQSTAGKAANTLSPCLRIYDAGGRVVKVFNNSVHSVLWNGTDDSGRRLPAGIYFVQLETDDYTAMEKVILLQ